jgi:hypothetical protein
VHFLRRILSEQQQGRHAPDAGKVTLADLRRLVEDDHLLKGRRSISEAWEGGMQARRAEADSA